MTNGEKLREIFPNIKDNEKDGHAFVHFYIEETYEKDGVTHTLTDISACASREWWYSDYEESKKKEVKKTCSNCGWCQTSDYPDDSEDTLVCANGDCEHCGRVLGTLEEGPIDVENCPGFEEPL